SYLEQIPESTFEQALNTDSAFVTDFGAYHAVITATGSGPLRVIARSYADGAVTGQATFYLPDAPSGAILTLDYAAPTTLDQLRLQVDLNGDGTVDETLAPYTAGAAADTSPPTTIGGANLSGPGVSTVQLAADDGAGSGVAATWFELPGDTTPRVYTGPFTAPLGSTVRFRSIDNAGNLEDVRTLVVDDVSNERAFAQPLAPPPPLQRSVDYPSDVDWFRFDADSSSSYEVQLGGAPGTTLALFAADGTLVATAPGGPGVKKIAVPPGAGTYYLEVAATSGAKTPIAYVIDLHKRPAHP
ncbi:MAG TPA: PPC domain-containing protein, partial [Gaiellaceae bacterium]|nr:PPC domain-containing protein [Gaiellaceae bacterium]